MRKTTYEDDYKVLWVNNQRNRTWDKRNQFKTSIKPTFYWIKYYQRTGKQEPRTNNPTTEKNENTQISPTEVWWKNTPEKQTRNSSVKFSQTDQEEKSNNSNQYNTKRKYAAGLRSNRPSETTKPDRDNKPTARWSLK